MDAAAAMTETNQIVDGLIAGLTPEHKEMPTPCDEWNVHELIEHMLQGGHMVAGALQDQPPPDDAPDVLADGPAAGWAGTRDAMVAAATPEALGTKHQTPFGEVPGEMVLSVIASDFLLHGWDLAQATDQSIDVSDELAEFALGTWQAVVPAEGRDGNGFADAVPVADDAPALDKVIGYTGRQP
jgi:uncharacterized protein (TIGR03086 family)